MIMAKAGGTPFEEHPVHARFTELWIRFDRRLRNFVAKRVHSREDVEDLVQGIYLKIHVKLDSVREPQRIDGWIFRIAENAVIDYYRRRARTEPLREEVVVVPDQPESLDFRLRLEGMITEMVAGLPQIYRAALLLVDIQGFRQEKAAEILGISLPGLKSRVQRGRRQLKKMLLDCCHFQFDRRGRVIDYSPRCRRCCSTDRCS